MERNEDWDNVMSSVKTGKKPSCCVVNLFEVRDFCVMSERSFSRLDGRK